jgi:5-methylcytosine-specific restriction endonuclease McrA
MPTAPQGFNTSTKRRQLEATRYDLRGTKQQRGYGGTWEALSKMKRAQTPICEVCGDEPATAVDHIVPITGPEDPGRLNWLNLQSICNRCHAIKTRHGEKGMGVVFVTGESGSGKTTYVARHRHAGELVWDMDVIAESLIAESTRGTERQPDVLQLLYAVRKTVLQQIKSGSLNRRCWVIWSDPVEAKKRAPINAMFIHCEKTW